MRVLSLLGDSEEVVQVRFELAVGVAEVAFHGSVFDGWFMLRLGSTLPKTLQRLRKTSNKSQRIPLHRLLLHHAYSHLGRSRVWPWGV